MNLLIEIEDEEFKKLQKFMKHDFKSININIEPTDVLVYDDMEKLFLGLLTKITYYQKPS